MKQSTHTQIQTPIHNGESNRNKMIKQDPDLVGLVIYYN